MARGGYRKPQGGPRPPSGPGKFSQRTDGHQAARVPPLAGSPDMQSGDVGRLQQAQRMVPLPSDPQTPPAQRAPGLSPGPMPGAPDFLFDLPSSRPTSPGTTGLSTGPGPGPEVLPPSTGPDVREQILEFLSRDFQNPEAAQMLQDIRTQRAQAQVPSYQVPDMPQPGPPSVEDVAPSGDPFASLPPQTPLPQPDAAGPPPQPGADQAAPPAEVQPPTVPQQATA